MTPDALDRTGSVALYGKRKMEIVINEEPLSCSDDLTVQELIAELGLSPDTVLVERNCEFVQRAMYSTTVLVEGDSLELLQIVGGG